MIEFDEYRARLLALEPDLAELGRGLGLQAAAEELAALEAEALTEGFWNDLARSQEVLKNTKRLRDKMDGFKKLKARHEDILTLCEMALEEGDASLLTEVADAFAALERDLSSARLATLLSGQYDNNNVIVSFHAGAGGTEAQDWAQMLFRMYTRWAERHGFSCKTLDYLDGDEAGIKSAALSIEGENAYGYLKGEHGVHRLVRISPFDSSGRRHTSFAALEVMPDLSGEDMSIDIRDEDLQVDTYRSGGAGGQHVNKTESAIRITHIPSGIVVACQNERSQHQNREVAMRMLKAKLLEIKEREHLDKIDDIKGAQRAIEWGSQIRSYVFMPYTLAKDHRTGFENGNIGAVMDGDIDGFVSAYLTALATGNWVTK
ncbi:MAG: peptide chain release factor 2 [Oscillospiraceae bacterium]|jgi:peptide chain release factor 2|nr:peptide chain release factor 2 [Oscillospiraceae bacterium]